MLVNVVGLETLTNMDQIADNPENIYTNDININFISFLLCSLHGFLIF
jgi:hypothetical protein